MKALLQFAPFLVAANVRGTIDEVGWHVAPGTGWPGDLVLGEVIPAPGEHITVFDQALSAHHTNDPLRVVAPLGTRESSTHVNGGIPAAGLPVADGTPAHWLAGESGLVGKLFLEGVANPSLKLEASVRFRCLGLLFDMTNAKVNIDRFALKPESVRLTTPLLGVAGTSTEAGKTVLVGKILRHIKPRRLRVAAIKATGTGGTMDSTEHRKAGADIVLDEVHGGLITTYVDPDTFRRRIVRPFRAAQDQNVDLIVTELGGDLISANVPTFLTMSEFVDNLRVLAVIANDPFSAAGAVRYLTEELGFAGNHLRIFSSPFRNPRGMALRMAALGVEETFDPNDEGHVLQVVEDFLEA